MIELVDHIEVFEPEKIGKERVCRIRVHYRLVDVVEETLADADEVLVVVEGGGSLERAV